MGQPLNTQRVLVEYDDFKTAWTIKKQNTPGGIYNIVALRDLKKDAVKKARKEAKKMPRGITGVLRVYNKSGKLSEETRYE